MNLQFFVNSFNIMAKLALLLLTLILGLGEETETETGLETETEPEPEQKELDPRAEFYEILDKSVWLFTDAFMDNECKEACAILGYGVGERLNEACALECRDFRSQPYFTMEDRPPLRDLRAEILNYEPEDQMPQDEDVQSESSQSGGGCGCSGGMHNEDTNLEEYEAPNDMNHGQELSDDEVKRINLDL